MRIYSGLTLRKLILVAVALAALTALAVPAPQSATQWQRLNDGNPILAPQGDGFESAGVFNPAVVRKDGRFVMLYRAQDKQGTSRLGYAESTDGIRFTRRAAPVLAPEADYERDGGVEDPRLVNIGGTYYLTYTAYNKKDAQLCLATSKDLVHWQRRGVIMPAYKGRWNVGWTKSGAILTEKVNGKYWMYYMADPAKDVNEMGVAFSTDLIHWTEALDQPVLKRRPGLFDAKVVEPGPPPVMTQYGIFLIYNGADEKNVYASGWVLFDKHDPTKVLARADRPVFRVEREWEQAGQVPNVVFIEGMAHDHDRWLFYYGGADKYVGVAATRSLPDVRPSVVDNRRR